MKTKIALSITIPALVIVLIVWAGSSYGLEDESANLFEVLADGEPHFSGETLEDNQGAVSVAVSPINLNNPTEALVFEISMDTHSVDLTMDLREKATLTTDTGLVVMPEIWYGAQGGHHVSGELAFPAHVDGRPVLEGVARLTLIIRDVDVPERVFVWDLLDSDR